MAKAKATISIDPHTWETVKSTYSNVSERIEELLEADVDVSEVEDEKILRRKKRELEQEKEDLEQEKSRIEDDLRDVDSQLQAVKSSLERKRREEEEKENKMQNFLDLFQEKTSETVSEVTGEVVAPAAWQKAEDIPDYWEDQLEKSKEDLWEEAEGEEK